MSTPILTTKLYTPPPRSNAILRPRLSQRLDKGLSGRLTLISAPAGFGKTTLVSQWASTSQRQIAWLLLDEGDSDPARFLTYFIAALQTLAPATGQWMLAALQTPQPPSPAAMLTSLVNDIAAMSDPFILVLDDYHLVEATAVDDALTFLLEHLPPQMHLVIAAREDPNLPLARLRARGQLSELRAADLRFTLAEATDFLNQVMGLSLNTNEIIALEKRTEGWIAGLQLAALALQGQTAASNELDVAQFIHSFSGSHRFVLDYLVEEVWRQQSEGIQTFLLSTAVLERMCAELCDAVVQDAAISGAETLAYLEQANLFVVPLDHERRWYRYHHLFADLLRQRLSQLGQAHTAELHRRASGWYEGQTLDLEAFQHAAAAGDIERAERLLAGRGMPLLFQGAARPVLRWLESLPTAVLDAHPYLWVTYANALLFLSQIVGVEEKLQAAEAAVAEATLAGIDELDDKTRDLIGYIATTRATIAVTQHQVEAIMTQSRRALAYLHPHNLPMRTATTWTLGYAHQLQGDRTAAGRAYTEAIAISQEIGHFIIHLMATLGLGGIQEVENQLHLAAETYRQALQLAGDPPLPVACDAYLGLARLAYEWNDLPTAQRHGTESVRLARQIERTNRFVIGQLFMARLRLAQGGVAEAVALVAQAEQLARQYFEQQLPAVTAVQAQLLLHQGNLAAAAKLAQTYDIPLTQARVRLAEGDATAALAVLEPWLRQVEALGWQDERLRALLLQALAYQAQGEGETAVQLLRDALTLAQPGGFIRAFVDEGEAMAQLLLRLKNEGGGLNEYVRQLLAAFDHERSATPASQPLLDPLSEREVEVLRLIAQGFSNREIGERLFLALNTVKGHNRRIFDKLAVQRRTEAVARARELGLL
jgi:LuxR family transcriptional regulator, maltose regulon positive regulatory protein